MELNNWNKQELKQWIEATKTEPVRCEELTEKQVWQGRWSTEKDMRPLVSIEDFCGRDFSYHMLRPNEWIIRNN